jgi:hypothetical protein
MVRRIERRLNIAATGTSEIEAMRAALHQSIRAMGIRVVLDPESDPALVDYFGVGSLTTLSGGIGGAAVGSVVGAFFRSAGFGTVVGALVGLIIGASAGVTAVQQGWRLRVGWLPNGKVSALLEPWI